MTLLLYQLHLNLADRSVRRDLGNAYDMHRTLSRAFSESDHGPVQPFLWRLEPSSNDELPLLLLQSSSPARWSQLPSGYLISCHERRWDPAAVLQPGRRVVFRLRANPTVHRAPPSETADASAGHSARGRRKRLGLWREAEQLEWLQRQAQRVGLVSVDAAVSQAERLRCRKRDNTITLASAQFDGRAIIADSTALVAAVQTGIGHGRMLGQGLLSLAPVRA